MRRFLERHKRLVGFFIAAGLAFIILHSVWYWVMGSFSVIGAVWAVKEYNKNEGG